MTDGRHRDRNTRNKSDSHLNPNRSFTSGGLNYYSLFSTVTVTCYNTNIDTSLYNTKKHQVVIPVYQPFVKVERKFPTKIENQILEVQKILRNAAEEGILMIEGKELLKKLNNNTQLIKTCEDYGVIHTTYRQFSTRKQIFHSLNLDLISHESILWCLRSLKRDEMTPNEKAIQSRIKEAFCYKVTTWLWEHLIISIKKASANFSKSHTYTVSNPQSSSINKKNTENKEEEIQHKEVEDIQESEFPALNSPNDLLPKSTNENKSSRNKPGIRIGGSERWSHHSKKFINTKTGKKLFYQFSDITKEDIEFEIEEDCNTTDSNMSTSMISSYIIYPAGETWVGFDQSTNDKVDPETYTIFIEFLKEYFTYDLQHFIDKYDSIIKNEGIEQDDKLFNSKRHRNSTENSTTKSCSGMNTASEERYKAIPGGRYG